MERSIVNEKNTLNHNSLVVDERRCPKCELLIDTPAANACALDSCPRRNPAVVARSAEIAAEGIATYQGLLKFLSSVAGELLTGDLNVERATAVSALSRQILDVLHAIKKDRR